MLLVYMKCNISNTLNNRYCSLIISTYVMYYVVHENFFTQPQNIRYLYADITDTRRIKKLLLKVLNCRYSNTYVKFRNFSGVTNLYRVSSMEYYYRSSFKNKLFFVYCVVYLCTYFLNLQIHTYISLEQGAEKEILSFSFQIFALTVCFRFIVHVFVYFVFQMHLDTLPYF